MSLKLKLADQQFPPKVSYRFNTWSTFCTFGDGDNCLTAALVDIVEWCACERAEAKRVAETVEDPTGDTYALGLFYPHRDTPGPHYTAILVLPRNPANMAVDAAYIASRAATGAEHGLPTFLSFKHTQSLLPLPGSLLYEVDAASMG